MKSIWNTVSSTIQSITFGNAKTRRTGTTEDIEFAEIESYLEKQIQKLQELGGHIDANLQTLKEEAENYKELKSALTAFHENGLSKLYTAKLIIRLT